MLKRASSGTQVSEQTNQLACACNDDVGAERNCRRHVDVDQKENFILVSIIDDRPVGDALGSGPQDWPGFESWWQAPIDRGWEAGIAGIQPVGMPAGLNLLPQR